MLRRGAAGIAALAVCAIVLGLPGCGDGNGDGSRPGANLPEAGGGGTLSYALPQLPQGLDPLAAQGRPALVVIRQIYEPLIEQVSGPYGDSTQVPGLALTARPSKDRTTWTLTLRPGVRFQDGAPFNAGAVLANARRWQSDTTGKKLLPHLFAVDAPRPDEVRFLLNAPVRDFPARLADPRLGIVSPQALDPETGIKAQFREQSGGAGTGAFKPATAAATGRVELSRFSGWWGSPVGLGPSFDGVAFVLTVNAAERLQLLQAGSIEVAEPLGPAQLKAAEDDPLLVTVGGPASGIGMEGSVRGIDSARAIPALSGVWLTRITG
jgi:peptide/nickel transport system substrate-binding protein